MKPLEMGMDEIVSPLGRYNYPLYELHGDVALKPTMLPFDCAYWGLQASDVETDDGSVKIVITTQTDVVKNEIVCCWWGEFLATDSARYRKLLHAKCDSLLKAVNLPILKSFMVLDNEGYVASHITKAEGDARLTNNFN